jgi:hypothetical protein
MPTVCASLHGTLLPTKCADSREGLTDSYKLTMRLRTGSPSRDS